MRLLKRYSFVAYMTGEGSTSGHAVHRQVQRYMQSKLEDRHFQQALDLTVRLLREQFPRRPRFNEPFDPFAPDSQPAEAYISHLVSVNEVSEVSGWKCEVPEEFVSILLDGSIYLWERGFLDQGRHLIAATERHCAQKGIKALSREIKTFNACTLSDIQHRTD